MKKELKGFIVGILIMSVLYGTAFADPIKKTLSVFYNNIKIYIDGTSFQLTDANGNYVEPFIFNGTTYIPVRAISKALNKTISWDGANNSIYIGKKPSEKLEEVSVSTVEEFYNALGSNKKILLKPGVYNLSNLSQKNRDNTNVLWQKVYDGNELVLQNIDNLTIEGTGDTPSEIIVEPRYAFVMNFINTSDIKIKNIKAGHTDQGQCIGGVFHFMNSKNLDIEDSQLYGCGTEGICLENVDTLQFTNSKIFQCTYAIMSIMDSKNIQFNKSSFTENGGFSLIKINISSNVLFDECIISNNYSDGHDNYLFCTYQSSDVVVKDSIIEDNDISNLRNDSDSVSLINTVIQNNSFITRG